MGGICLARAMQKIFYDCRSSVVSIIGVMWPRYPWNRDNTVYLES